MTVEVDCRGQVCPLPVIALAKAFRDLEVGETVEPARRRRRPRPWTSPRGAG